MTLPALSGLGPELAAFIGASLAELVERVADGIDARFEGVDADALTVFGERASSPLREGGTSRLHRAALVP